MVTCSECGRRAQWLVMVEGQDWIERFCSDHLRAPAAPVRYEVHAYAA